VVFKLFFFVPVPPDVISLQLFTPNLLMCNLVYMKSIIYTKIRGEERTGTQKSNVLTSRSPVATLNLALIIHDIYI
jgi:hypothetical protein